MALVGRLAFARREAPLFDRLVIGSGQKHIIVLGVECDAKHPVAAMSIVSYIVTDTDRPRATGDRALVVASARYTCNGTAHNREERKGRLRVAPKGLLALAVGQTPHL